MFQASSMDRSNVIILTLLLPDGQADEACKSLKERNAVSSTPLKQSAPHFCHGFSLFVEYSPFLPSLIMSQYKF